MSNAKRRLLWHCGSALLTIALVVLLFTRIVPGMTQATVAVVLLLAVVGCSLLPGAWPGLMAAATGALCYNFAFIPPVGTLHIASAEDAVAFAVFCVTAVTVSGLSSALARRADELARQKREVEDLHRLATVLIETPDTPAGAAAIAERIVAIFGAEYCGIHVPDAAGHWQQVSRCGAWTGETPLPPPGELHQRTLDGLVAEHGLGVRYCQLATPRGTVGMLVLRAPGLAEHAVTAIAGLVALALQRNRIAVPAGA